MYQYCSEEEYKHFLKKDYFYFKLPNMGTEVALLHHFLYSDRNGCLSMQATSFKKKVEDAFEKLFVVGHLQFLDEDSRVNLYGKLFKKKLAVVVLESLSNDATRWIKYTEEVERQFLIDVKGILKDAKIDLTKQTFTTKGFPKTVIGAVSSGLKRRLDFIPNVMTLTLNPARISAILVRIRDELIATEDAIRAVDDAAADCLKFNEDSVLLAIRESITNSRSTDLFTASATGGTGGGQASPPASTDTPAEGTIYAENEQDKHASLDNSRSTDLFTASATGGTGGGQASPPASTDTPAEGTIYAENEQDEQVTIRKFHKIRQVNPQLYARIRALIDEEDQKLP